MKKIYFLYLCLLFSCNLIAQYDSVIHTSADVMPYFPGCEEFKAEADQKRHCSNLALVAYISQSIRYPEAARENDVEGTVYASFIVDKKGNVSQPIILRDIGSGCAQASIDVIENMPRWEPGIHQGKTVAVKLTIPIRFYLEDEEPDLSLKYKITWGNLKGDIVSKADLINNFDREVTVRNQYGEDVSISVLHFAYKRNRTFLEAKSTGRVTDSMKKIIHKIKRGGDFAIKATIQDSGQIVDVMDVFTIKR